MSALKLKMHAERPEIARHLRDRERHPMARPCITPAGAFPSAALAAEHYGLYRQAIVYRIRPGKPGYAWV
jgi:hypothetical protein